jgi:hypothetical protein
LAFLCGELHTLTTAILAQLPLVVPCNRALFYLDSSALFAPRHAVCALALEALLLLLLALDVLLLLHLLLRVKQHNTCFASAHAVLLHSLNHACLGPLEHERVLHACKPTDYYQLTHVPAATQRCRYAHAGACASLIGMTVAIATLSSVPSLAAATGSADDDNDHEKRPSFAMSTRSVDSSSSSAAERGEARRRGSLREPLLVATTTGAASENLRRASYTVGEQQQHQQHQQQQQYRRVSFTDEQEPLAALTAVAADI